MVCKTSEQKHNIDIHQSVDSHAIWSIEWYFIQVNSCVPRSFDRHGESDHIVRPEIPIVSWVLADPLSHKVGQAQSPDHKKIEVIHLNWSMNRDMEYRRLEQIASITVVLSLFPQFSSMTTWGDVPYDQVMEEKNDGKFHAWFGLECEHKCTRIPLRNGPNGLY